MLESFGDGIGALLYACLQTLGNFTPRQRGQIRPSKLPGSIPNQGITQSGHSICQLQPFGLNRLAG
ncbi:hypothetical protein D3C77_300410 [compost metagenome]